ncbi:MAG: hypothetical protein LBQ66_15250 [Planctomycetaceae bacterium]|nr:hypothetical protein [Planctomycetaceae bacterium]
MANVLRHVLAFLPNSFGFLMHCGGRDTRVPVRAASRQLSAIADVCVLVFPVRLGDPVVGLRRRNRLAVGCPPYDHQNVWAFLPNLFGFLMHLGGRDARVPVPRRFAAIVGYADRGDGLEYQHDSRPISSVASPRR